MKNREKYAEELLNVACTGNRIAIDKRTMQIRGCAGLLCGNCLFSNYGNCNTRLAEWAESEYIEKLVISKRDRAFLEYLGKELKYIARGKSDNLIAYQNSAEKREDGLVFDSGAIKSLQKLNIDFPMVKWEDDKPWLIEDLKKLEVVEEYEKH